ncbi:hypothetical protein HPB51_013377 [Rhipicephalus microplus]|uniref:Uncharacterized protein n=1 Tax=Rhipicephalus microplus TaxID=6941 RepID=A0A9J6F369_RHIMP|nr:hypothetical protein HPB51_013377 [Rhipicephalus microplus]
MATGSASVSGRRRSSRGISLLPSQDNFVKDLPTDIPEEDRLRILLRLCFRRTLATLADEVDGFDDLHEKLLVQAAVAAEHHELLKSLVAEHKRWNELLAEDVHLEPGRPLVNDDAARMPVARQRHYDMLLESAERSRRKAVAILSNLPARGEDEDDDGVAVGDSTAELFDV